jgi:hypothetical protein
MILWRLYIEDVTCTGKVLGIFDSCMLYMSFSDCVQLCHVAGCCLVGLIQ